MSKNSQEKKKEEREIFKIPKISAARRGDNNVRDKLDLWITEHREGRRNPGMEKKRIGSLDHAAGGR